jgi:SAM-dependent methyltransferase
MDQGPGTWHYGLIARWWAEFNEADPIELAYYRAAIEQFGQPALDLACGAGRLLVPLLAAGLDVDGVDISPDMIAHARAKAIRKGLAPRLAVGAMDELDLGRTYRTIYICDSFGLGGRRDRDREALRTIYHHLAPGGGLVFSHWLPYEGSDERQWARWQAGNRHDLPRDWPADGERRPAADGDEIELISRLAELDPLRQVKTLEMRARLWHAGHVIAQEEYSLRENLYFAQELILMLAHAGFGEIAIEAGYGGRPATPDDGFVVFVARRTEEGHPLPIA